MSLPPDDKNPNDIKGLLGELSQELEEAGFVEHGVRDELLVGIQDSLRALFGDMMEHEAPNVTVVEGGRDVGAPPSDAPRPELRVADYSSEPKEEEIDTDRDFSFDSPNVSVRFLRPNASTPLHSLSSGNIHLAQEGDEQTIYTGLTSKMYRLLLFKGKVEVCTDQKSAGVLTAKQSMDVEGEKIIIRAISDEVSGTYSLIDFEQ
jgi:hypothetical protein